ncbi:MAG: hypothetical protein AAB360_03750 [Patescibacteria group bacterium]
MAGGGDKMAGSKSGSRDSRTKRVGSNPNYKTPGRYNSAPNPKQGGGGRKSGSSSNSGSGRR